MEADPVKRLSFSQDSASSSRRVLFVVAILASAFLIFLVQPMVGKRILPWFGGVPSVWTLCLAFYQTTLFFGYAYAHLLVRFATPKLQLGIHAIFIVAALAAMPVLPGDTWKPIGQAASPSLYIFQMLTSNVALPFLVLASTGPLVQAWFARSYPNRSPYPLYAVSNIGSFAALLAYPFLLEPRLPLSTTGAIWTYSFAATAAAVLCCAWVAIRSSVAASHSAGPGTDCDPAPDNDLDRLGVGRVALWCLLPGCAVILLMGTTNSVCLDTASLPFLWIMPLAVYLFTFILCFSSERVYRPTPYLVVVIIAMIPTVGLPVMERLGLAMAGSLIQSVYLQISAYCALLFGGCMVMHGELYRMRPDPRSLTTFYLCVSGGGALGGLAVGLLAPVVLDGYYELGIGLLLAAVLYLAATALVARASEGGGSRRWRWSAAAPLSIILLMLAMWPAGSVYSKDTVYQGRTFFGVLRVLDMQDATPPMWHFLSGTTLHGVQFKESHLQHLSTTYYGQATGVGLALAAQPPDRPMEVGVVGLGIGTLAAFGREGDSFRFYEIDPAVVDIARDSEYFTYLSDTAADVEVVIGDARLTIEDEQEQGGSQEFDYLIVDAFSSHAIPIHLMTLEAFEIYAKSLAPDGIMAVHVSSRHFDLMPLVARAGFEVGLDTLYVRTAIAPYRQSRPSNWVLLSSDPTRLKALGKDLRKRVKSIGLPPRHLNMSQPSEREIRKTALWTDDYSDLFGALSSY